MKEEFIYKKAKKIRNKLIYYIHLQLNQKSKNNNHYLMINSLTPKELNSKYQKCSDFCIEKIETYTSSGMNYGTESNNYFHISLTYSSLSNNYHMLIDNKNINQMIGENNIVGKYYKGNEINIRSTIRKANYNINEKEISLEKMKIGDKKFIKKKRINCSSEEITKNIFINEKENNDNNNINFVDKINSNHNNYKKLINININNDINKKNQTNANKIKRPKNHNIINIYTIKLKKYCSTLKIIKKKEASNFNKNKNLKQYGLASPSITDRKKNCKKERHYTVKSEKNHPKLHSQLIACQDFHFGLQTENQNLVYNKNTFQTKLKSQTKIPRNLFKIKEKKIANRKNRAQTIDISERKVNTPKKPSPKKGSLPSKKLINSMRMKNETQFPFFIQKYAKKSKGYDININKLLSGGIDIKKKLFMVNKVNYRYTSTNGYGFNLLNSYKASSGINKKSVNKNFKRANTGISKIYSFRGSEIKYKEK